MQGILAVTAVGLTAALLALARELGLRLLAPLVPALALFLPGWLPFSRAIAFDLNTYKAENVGRMIAFCAVVAGIAYVRGRGGPALALVAGALLAVAGLTHLVPALIAGLMLALYAVAAALIDRGLLRRVLVGAGATAAVFGVSYLGVLGLAGGDLGFQRATSGSSFTGLPRNVDPTYSFGRQKLIESTPEGRFYIPPRDLVKRFASQAIPLRDSARLAALVLAALALATIGMVLIERALLPLAIVTWGVAITLLAVGIVFSYRFGTLIPQLRASPPLWLHDARPGSRGAGLPRSGGKAADAPEQPRARGAPARCRGLAIWAAAARIPERSLPPAENGWPSSTVSLMSCRAVPGCSPTRARLDRGRRSPAGGASSRAWRRTSVPRSWPTCCLCSSTRASSSAGPRPIASSLRGSRSTTSCSSSPAPGSERPEDHPGRRRPGGGRVAPEPPAGVRRRRALGLRGRRRGRGSGR